MKDDMTAGWLEPAHDGVGGGCFSAAAFADQPQRLLRGDIEGDVVDRFDLTHLAPQQAGADGVVFFKVSHFEDSAFVSRHSWWRLRLHKGSS